MKRIKRFGVYQTAKVFGVIYFSIAVVILVPIWLLVSMFGSNSPSVFPFGGGMFFIILPFIYGILGFLISALGCAIYNFIAKYTGGFEFEIEVEQQNSMTTDNTSSL